MTVLSFYYVTQSFHEKNHRLENLDFRNFDGKLFSFYSENSNIFAKK